MGGEKTFNLRSQLVVVARRRRHEPGAFRSGLFERLVENLLGALPSCVAHDSLSVVGEAPPPSAWNNHARANAHSRFTVRSEIPSACAVSSTDNPAKKRSRTTSATEGSCCSKRRIASSRA